jgi:SAM-dependent methyltransferase
VSDIRTVAGQQYAGTANLDARVTLHRAFSTAERSWPLWVFDRLQLTAGETVVELGAGTGALWQENAARLPPGVRLLLSDRSAAMCQALRRLGVPGLLVAQADAAQVPAASACADVVIASHMLYHLPEPDAALAEMARLIRPEGRAVVTTNGAGHLRQLRELLAELKIPVGPPLYSPFPLHTARARLSAVFGQVELLDFDNALRVTDPQPVVRYVASLTTLSAEQARLLHDAVAERISPTGAFHIDKVTGLLIARH